MNATPATEPRSYPHGKRRFADPPAFQSPEDARTFASYSVRNAAIVRQVLACDCEPYEDVFTMRRWNAQGRKVVKGQRGHAIPVLIPVVYEDEDGTEQYATETRTVNVFCRCQTEPLPATWRGRR